MMIPFVAEIVPEIDLEEQRAVIDPPPGLLGRGPRRGRRRDATGDEHGDGA